MADKFKLEKKTSELLSSRNNIKNPSEPETKVTYYHNRKTLWSFFLRKIFVRIKRLVKKMGASNDSPGDERDLIESSKRNFKCDLLHNGNKFYKFLQT